MMFMEENYRVERESREKRLAAYAEKIQEYTLEQSIKTLGDRYN